MFSLYSVFFFIFFISISFKFNSSLLELNVAPVVPSDDDFATALEYATGEKIPDPPASTEIDVEDEPQKEAEGESEDHNAVDDSIDEKKQSSPVEDFDRHPVDQ